MHACIVQSLWMNSEPVSNAFLETLLLAPEFERMSDLNGAYMLQIAQ